MNGNAERVNDPECVLDTSRRERPYFTVRLSELTDKWKRMAAKGSVEQREALRAFRRLTVEQQDQMILTMLRLEHPNFKALQKPKYMYHTGPAYDASQEVRELSPVPVGVVVTGPVSDTVTEVQFP